MKYEGCKLDQRWQESKLHVHYIAWKGFLVKYRKALVLARSSYYSNLIETNKNNPRFIFATLDRLMNPSPNNPTLDIGSYHSCNDCLHFFKNKILDIRNEIPLTPAQFYQLPIKAAMGAFSLITLQELTELVRQ